MIRGRRLRRCIAAIIFAFLSAPAFAVEPGEMLRDPALEARARTISAELRCLVCQNESIDESHADLARDIRLIVRQRLEAGDTNAQARDYLVARYGQFILLKPPFEWQTLLLWGTPVLALLLGAAGIFLVVRRKTRPDDETLPLTEEERQRLDGLLAEGPGGGKLG